MLPFWKRARRCRSYNTENHGGRVRALSREGVSLRAGVEIAKLCRQLAKVQVTLAGAARREVIEGSVFCSRSGGGRTSSISIWKPHVSA